MAGPATETPDGKPEDPAGDAPRTFGLRIQAAVYICGVFSSGASSLVFMLIPLWAVELGASPFMVGISLGAYTFLPLLLSIPGGAWIDRLGARRVILVFGLVVVMAFPLYPALPWVPALIVLQMIAGLSISMGWIGAQSLIGEVMKGDPVYAGRLAFAVRTVTLAGPPILGLIWDFIGPWGAFAFIAMWTSGMVVGALMLPNGADEAARVKREPLTLASFRPQLGSYVQALRMMAIPAVMLVVAISLLRQSGQGIQSSFYIVWLQQSGYGATLIGTLLSTTLVAGAFSALACGWLTRVFHPFWLLVGAVFVSVAGITITPILGTYVLLLIVMAVRGVMVGVIQPVTLSIVTRAAGAGHYGKAVALRATANRLAMTVIPITMGAVVEVVGIENAFYVVGGTLIVLLAGLAIHIKRSPAFDA